jgi:hypothetical protein
MVTDKRGATRSEFIANVRGKHASELMLPSVEKNSCASRRQRG